MVHRHVLGEDPDAKIAAFYVWSPIMSADDEASAHRLQRELSDPRARFIWDADKSIGTALKRQLDVGAAPFAWDVYCYFDADAEWGREPPRVARWAHQLSGADARHYFGDRLGEVLASWRVGLEDGEGQAAPEAMPDDLLFIDAADVRPLPEVLLDKVVADLRDVSGMAESVEIEELIAELRRRMAEATQPHAANLPRAVILDGQVLVVQGSCAEQPDTR